MLGILLKMFTFLLVYFVSSTRCFFCVNFDKRNIFEIFHTFILLLQNYNQCINIPKTVSEILTMGESIQIKKVHSVYITLWTLHLRKEGELNVKSVLTFILLYIPINTGFWRLYLGSLYV